MIDLVLLAAMTLAPAGPTGVCEDPALASASVSTRLTVSTRSERPSITADTVFVLPSRWSGSAALAGGNDRPEHRAALACLFPEPQTAYREAAPEVTIGDSEAARSVGGGPVGDELTVRSTTATEASDVDPVPRDLDVWRLTDRTRDRLPCLDGGPMRTAPESWLLEVCSASPGLRAARWKVDVVLDGPRLASSSAVPVEFTPGASATWLGASLASGAPLWVELSLPPSAAGYYAFRAIGGSAAALLPAALFGTAFVVFVVALMRLLRLDAHSPPLDAGTRTARTALGLAVGGLVGAVGYSLVGVASVVSGDPSSNSPWARAEAASVLVLVAILGVSSWRRRRLAALAAVLAAVLLGLAYFGPEVGTLETGQSPLGYGVELSSLKVVGYLWHAVLGAVAVAVLAVFSCRLLYRWSTRIGLGSSAATLVRPLSTRAARAVLGVAFGVGAVAQWIAVTGRQWDHRRLVPGSEPSYPEEARDVVLGNLPWFPDFLLGWLPMLFFYLALPGLAVTLILRRAGARPSSATMEPNRAEIFALAVLFSAGVLGIYGSYRGLQFPLAFLLGVTAVVVAVRPTGRLAAEVTGTNPTAIVQGELDAAQLRLLRDSGAATAHLRRSEEVARRFEKGGISAAGVLMERALQPVIRKLDGVPRSVAAPIPGGRTPVELAVALGPRATWWGNARYATAVGAIVSALAVAYDLYRYVGDGRLFAEVGARSGVFEVLRTVAFEISSWLVAAFVLGGLWSLLPGRRGFLKGLSLGLLALGAAGAETAVALALGQDATTDFGSWPVLLLGFLVLVGVILEIATVKKVEPERWELIHLLRLRDTRWIATYGVTLVIVGTSLVHAVQSGEPLINQVPQTVQQVVGGGGVGPG